MYFKTNTAHLICMMHRLDSYPQGFDCSNPTVWRPVTTNYHTYHESANPSQAWYFPGLFNFSTFFYVIKTKLFQSTEFQGGSFDAWGPTAPGNFPYSDILPNILIPSQATHRVLFWQVLISNLSSTCSYGRATPSWSATICFMGGLIDLYRNQALNRLPLPAVRHGERFHSSTFFCYFLKRSLLMRAFHSGVPIWSLSLISR